MINDTSQRSVATWFRCGGPFGPYFITNLLLSLFWENFWNSSTFGKVTGEKLCLERSVRWGTVPLKDEELVW